MTPFTLLFELMQQAVPNPDLWWGLLFTLLAAWIVGVSTVAVKNWDTPRRLDKVDEVITETIPAINSEMSSMNTSIGHLGDQINAIYAHIMNQPPNPTTGDKPAPNYDSEQ